MVEMVYLIQLLVPQLLTVVAVGVVFIPQELLALVALVVGEMVLAHLAVEQMAPMVLAAVAVAEGALVTQTKVAMVVPVS